MRTDRGPRIALLLAGVGLTALTAACSSSTPTPATTVTATETVTSSPSSTSSSTSTTSSASSSSSSSGSAAGNACTAATAKAAVAPAAGGGSAGHVQYDVTVTNTSSSPCVLDGYPGVSLVVGQEGQQLGAPAQRTPATASPITLAPGAKSTAAVQVAEAGNFPNCGVTAAAGFRIYLPNDTAAQFSAQTVQGCSNASVILMEVKPFGAA